ncbi:MAG: hypothetical protein M3N82_16140 [Pseudomonadota bacterium]|nr:hypothetical protein [Pseudomonadota bacterium]
MKRSEQGWTAAEFLQQLEVAWKLPRDKWDVDKWRHAALWLAAAQDAAAAAERRPRGRPKAGPANKLLVLQASWGIAPASPMRKPSKKRGPPARVDVGDAELLFAIDLGRQAGDKTQIAAIERMVRGKLSAAGKNTAGPKVKTIASTLQRRVPKARRGVPK